MSKETNIQKILEIFEDKKIIRPRDLDAYVIPRRYLSLMHQRGILQRTSRGLYELPGSEISEFHTYAQIIKRIPKGVVCLLSALRFHNLTTQQSPDVWIAVNRKENPSFRFHDLPVRIIRFSGRAFTGGIEQHQIDEVPLQVYSIPKTIADCFKFRNKIGNEVAIEALRQTIQEQRCSMDTLWQFAKICRVSSVMRPYMESLR